MYHFDAILEDLTGVVPLERFFFHARLPNSAYISSSQSGILAVFNYYRFIRKQIDIQPN